MTQNQIMQRLDRLERKVVDLQKRLGKSGEKKNGKTWRDYVGMFKDDPDFKKAVQDGVKWRRSFRPKPADKTGKK